MNQLFNKDARDIMPAILENILSNYKLLAGKTILTEDAPITRARLATYDTLLNLLGYHAELDIKIVENEK